MHGNRLRTVSCYLNSGKDRSLGAHLLVQIHAPDQTARRSQLLHCAVGLDQRCVHYIGCRRDSPVFIPFGGPQAHLGQPRKLEIEGGDGFGGSLGEASDRRDRLRRWGGGGAHAGAPVTRTGAAAARSNPAQLGGSLTEQTIRLVVKHVCSPCTTFIAWA